MKNWSFDTRNVLAFVHDVAAAALAWALAFWLRFNLDIPPGFGRALAITMLVSAPVHAAIFLKMGLYRGSWRYASLHDFQRIVFGVVLGALGTATVLVIFRLDGPVPRSAFLLAPILLAVAMGGSRILYRAIKERVLYGSVRLSGEPVLIIGAGDTTFNLLKGISRGTDWRAVGILDDDPTWQGRVLAGVRVIGTIADIPRIGTRMGARYVIVALPTAAASARRRLAELACLAMQGQDHTRFVTVRFGNVLGSTGSVIPKFREQIARGGPVTVTHPEIQRYFMSIPEAAQLVLQAGLMGNGGEIFVLDMGEPVKIVDLARDMIRLSGLSVQDVKIEFTGLRPGEKLFEELLADDEHTLPTPHPKLRVARAAGGLSAEAFAGLTAWIERSGPPGDVRAELARFVPEYRPAGSAGD